MQRSVLYNGIIPNDNDTIRSLSKYFNNITKQISEQPDIMWSCRSRSNLLAIFHIANRLYQNFISGDVKKETYINKIIDYIHLNLCENIAIDL